MIVDGWMDGFRGEVCYTWAEAQPSSPRPPMNRSRALLNSDPYRTAWHALCLFGPFTHEPVRTKQTHRKWDHVRFDDIPVGAKEETPLQVPSRSYYLLDHTMGPTLSGNIPDVRSATYSPTADRYFLFLNK